MPCHFFSALLWMEESGPTEGGEIIHFHNFIRRFALAFSSAWVLLRLLSLLAKFDDGMKKGFSELSLNQKFEYGFGEERLNLVLFASHQEMALSQNAGLACKSCMLLYTLFMKDI